jgi:uncharacterized protein (TIGR02996 family)
VKDAITAGDWPRALEKAVDLWRVHRTPELADLVDALAARCPQPPAPKVKDVQAWWLAHGKRYDVRAITVLVAQAGVRLAHADAKRRTAPAGAQGKQLVDAMKAQCANTKTNAIDRLACILAWPDDPRTAQLLGTWLVEAPVRWDWLEEGRGTHVFYEAVAARLAELADARQVPRLADSVAAPRGAIKQLQQIQRTLGQHVIDATKRRKTKVPEPLAAEVAACLAQLASAKAPEPKKAEPTTLWEAIAKRDDHATRAVLGDALLERGDPRGELIALQLAGGAKAEKAAHQLVGKHWDAWLGDLALVLNRKGTVFHAGMLAEVRVGIMKTPEWAFTKVHGHRELATVRVARPGHVRPPHFAAFLAGLPRLERVGVDWPEVIDEMRARRKTWPGIRALEYGEESVRDRYRSDFPPLAETFAAIAQTLPALVEIRFADLAWPEDVAAQLRTLVPALPAMFRKLARIVVAPAYRALAKLPLVEVAR